MVRPARMIADTRYVEFDVSIIMKGFGYHPHRTLDEATQDSAAPSDLPRVSARRAATVLLVGAILACLHREISGSADGSLLSAVTAYAGGTLHHLASILLNRAP